MKYCTHCERQLPFEAFHLGGRGGLNGRCKRCSRYFAREWYRRQYRTNPEFRGREVARCSANARARWAARSKKAAA